MQGRVRSWLATIHKSIGGQGGMILEPWLHHFGIGGSTPSTPTIGQADNTNNVLWLDALSSQAGLVPVTLNECQSVAIIPFTETDAS